MILGISSTEFIGIAVAIICTIVLIIFIFDTIWNMNK